MLTLELLQEDEQLTPKQIQLNVQLQCAILKILKEEELYWYRRSHEKWFAKGDNMTKYFHTIANGRKRKDTIISLLDGNYIIEGDDNLLKHATDFFKDLFGPAM